MLHYFAYGSNLHPARITERVKSANLVTATQVFGYQLRFHKLGQDDSAKCNLWHTGDSSDSVFGAIYTIALRHKYLLDEFEGKGSGYIDSEIEVPHGGETLRCFTYLAQNAYIMDTIKPYDWYKQLVIRGARYLDFPEKYLQKLNAVDSQTDPDSERKQIHYALLQGIANYPAHANSRKHS